MMIRIPYRRALVTGGAGFIGSHIVEELLRLGVEVVSIDNYFAGKRENLSGLPNQELLTEVNCDVTDYEKLKRHFEDVEVVFHNAASKKTICLNDPRRDLEINAEGAFNVLELARDFGVEKIVHASTGSVYGEAQYYPQDEEHPLVPTSYYGVSKLAGEKYAKVFERLYDMDISVLRYFHVYGPRQESADERGGVVAIFCRRVLSGLPPIIYGDGTQQRSFTYVKDVVRANLLVATSPEAKGQVYNCASGLKITVGELAEKVLQLSGQEVLKPKYDDWTPGDIKVFDVDHSKIESLGLRNWTSFDGGLQKTLEWYRSVLSK
jgi:nucleoside-diphosphate-sugar epimerase